jgi:hypothetical protein
MKTKEDHKKRHVELHRALDELLADYIRHNPDKDTYTQSPLIDLIEWSYKQTQDPTEIITHPEQ